MDYIQTLDPSLTPYTKLNLHAGTKFKPGVGSSTASSDLSLVIRTNQSWNTVTPPTGFFDALRGHLYQIKILKVSASDISSSSGFKLEFKIGNRNRSISPDYKIPSGTITLLTTYNLDDVSEMYGVINIDSSDSGHTITIAGDRFAGGGLPKPYVEFNKSPSLFTQGDTWIFPDYDPSTDQGAPETTDTTNYLVSSNQFSFQGGAVTDQFTYLGNTIQLELLKSIDGDRLFDPNYENNYFFLQNWGMEGYRAKLELVTGFSEGGEQIAFLGYIENIIEKRNTIVVELGDGIYKAKEIHAHGIGILETRRDLRQVGEVIAQAIDDELGRSKTQDLTYTAAHNEIKFDTYFKPIVKGFSGQKLFIRPLNKNTSYGEYEAEIVEHLNYSGKLDSSKAIVKYNQGEVNFESPPIKESIDPAYPTLEGSVFFSFKHAYKWKHPTFLAKKLFQKLGYKIDENNFETNFVESDEGRVFSRNGRIFTNTGDRSREVTYSLAYLDNDPITYHQNGNSIGESFYFAIGNQVIQHNPNTGDDLVIYKSVDSNGEDDKTKVIYKVLADSDNLVWFETELPTHENSKLKLGMDDFSCGRVKIHRKQLVNLMGSTNWNTLTGDGTIIFTTPPSTSYSNFASGNTGGRASVPWKSNWNFNFDYTLAGSIQNKDYSNQAFLKGDYLYFILQTKADCNLSTQKQEVKTGGDKKWLPEDLKSSLYDKHYLIKLNVTAASSISHPTISTASNNFAVVTPGISYKVVFKFTNSNHGLEDNDLVVLTNTTAKNFYDGVWRVDGDFSSDDDVRLELVHSWWSGVQETVPESTYIRRFDALVHNPSTTPLTTSEMEVFNLNTYNSITSNPGNLHSHRKFFGTQDDKIYNKSLENKFSWKEAWGRTTQNRIDFTLDSNGDVYVVDVTGDGGQTCENGKVSDQTGTHKIRISKYFSNSSLDTITSIPTWSKETTFKSVYDQFFTKPGVYKNIKYHQTGKDEDKDILHPDYSSYIPYDLWGICKSSNLITICTHWVNRNANSRTVTEDFKSIVLFRIDSETNESPYVTGTWLHENETDNDTSSGIKQNFSSDNPNTENQNKTSTMFFIQRNLVQGTDDETTYDSLRNYPRFSGEDGDKVWNKETYFLPQHYRNVLTLKETMGNEVRGTGELSVLPKNPVVWIDDNGDESIVYLGGNFGPYLTNSKIASKISNVKFKYRTIGLATDVAIPEDGEDSKLSELGVYSTYPSENSHGRLIKFTTVRKYNQQTSGYENIKVVNWEYLGYPVVNRNDDVYKDFSSEIVLDSENNLHFITARANRGFTNKKHKIDYINKKKDSILFYRIVGSRAELKHLDRFAIENPENFMWTQYSTKLATKLPLVDMNDKYIYDVLKNLALIMNYEFGIENEKPFFRNKNKYKSLITGINDTFNGNISVADIKTGYSYTILEMGNTTEGVGSIWASLGAAGNAYATDAGDVFIAARDGTSSDGTGRVILNHEFLDDKMYLVGNEIIRRGKSILEEDYGGGGNGSDDTLVPILVRGMFGTTKSSHPSTAKAYLLSLLSDINNIIDIKDYSLDYDYIYDQITGKFRYYSPAENKSIDFEIVEKADYQDLFDRNLDLNIPFISDNNWASVIVSRYNSLLSVKNYMIDMSIKYSPFLKSGEVIAIKNEDYNIDYEPFLVLNVSHDLSSFVTNIKARSIKQPLLTISGSQVS